MYASIKVNVARSQDEAERQARGENVIASAIEAERTQAEAAPKELAANSITNDPAARAE